MTTNKFEAPAHVQEAISQLLKTWWEFSGTNKQMEVVEDIIQSTQDHLHIAILGFEYGKMIGKREERAKRKNGIVLEKNDLERLSNSLENVLTAEGSFVFEITDVKGTSQQELTREEFLEHSVDVLLHQVNGLIEKMEESK